MFKSPVTGSDIYRLVVPKVCRIRVLQLAHESPFAGHLGISRTTFRITQYFYWPNMGDEIVRYCKSCAICQLTVSRGTVPKMPLGTMPLIGEPFKRVAVDIVGPLGEQRTRRGNRYILTLMDYASRYPEAVALRNIDTQTVAEALLDIYSRVGIPEEILSDQGTQFLSNVMREVSRLLQINQKVTSPYHPMCNGLVERFNGTLKKILIRLADDQPRDWDRFLPAALFAYREVPSESTGFSPFELLYGRTVRGPTEILYELWTKEGQPEEVRTSYQYVLELKDRLSSTMELVKENLSRDQKRQKSYFDRRTRVRHLKEGDQVLILLPTTQDKLTMRWSGPYPVVGERSKLDYWIQIGTKRKLFHLNMLKKFEIRPEEPQASVNACVVHEDEQPTEETIPCPGLYKSASYEDIDINQQLTQDQLVQCRLLVKKFANVFSDVPGRTNRIEHRVDTTSDHPVKSKSYPLPYSTDQIIKKEIQR